MPLVAQDTSTEPNASNSILQRGTRRKEFVTIANEELTEPAACITKQQGRVLVEEANDRQIQALKANALALYAASWVYQYAQALRSGDLVSPVAAARLSGEVG